MAVPIWKFVLVNSNDLSEVGELFEARGKSLSLGLNTAGSASFTYPFSGELSDELSVVDKGIKAYRKGSEGVFKLIWSGYINEISDDVESQTTTVACVGWFERLNKRLCQQQAVFTAKPDNDIIMGTGMSSAGGACPSGVIHLANATSSITNYTIPGSMTIPIVSGASPNTPTLIASGTYFPTVDIPPASAAANQNVTIQQYESFGEVITKLTQQENGCDFYVTPDTRKLDIYRKRGLNKTSSVYFGYNWGPQNISRFSRTINTQTFSNYIVGRANNIAAQSIQTDTTSNNRYGIFESVSNLGTDVKGATELASYIAAEYLFSSRPEYARSFSITPYPYTTESSVPEPFKDYDIGDLVKFRAAGLPKRFIGQTNGEEGSARIFGLNVDISDDGSEIIGDLQIYAS